MKSIVSYKQINKIDSILASLFTKNPEMRQSKLGALYDAFIDQYIVEIQKEYSKKLSRIHITHASTDEKTRNLMRSDTGRGFEYTPEKLIQVLDEEDALNTEFELKQIEVDKMVIDADEVSDLTSYERSIISNIFHINDISNLVSLKNEDLGDEPTLPGEDEPLYE